MAECKLIDHIAGIRKLIDQLAQWEHYFCQLMGPTGRPVLEPVKQDPSKFKVIHLLAKAQSVKKCEGCRQWRWGESISGLGVNIVKLICKSHVVWNSK